MNTPTLAFQPRLRPALAATAIFLAIAVMAACGGGGKEDDATATPEGPAGTPTSAVGDGTIDKAVPINQAFWHAGWKVTLIEATLQQGDFGTASVAIEAAFENLGSDPGTFDSQVVLVSGAQNYQADDFNQDVPNVPGELTGSGTFAFSVDEAFTFDNAAVIIGNPDNNQARVALGVGGGDYVSLEPRPIDVAGVAVAGPLTLSVTGAELRADLPDIHSEMEEGKLALTISFSAIVGNGIPIGQGVLQDQNVALKLPDGTAVAVRSDGRSGVNELLQGKEGTTISDLSVRFEVNDPAEGQYALVVRGQYVTVGTTTEGELQFTVQ